MKKLLTLIFLLVITSSIVLSQQFSKSATLTTEYNEAISSHWLDLAKAGTTNIIIQVLSGSGSKLIKFDSIQQLSPSVLLDSLSNHVVLFSDINNDNRLDVIACTKESDQTRLTVIDIDLTGIEVLYTFPVNNIHSFYVADWDHNGFNDLLYQQDTLGMSTLKVLLNSQTGFNVAALNLRSFNTKQQLELIDLTNNTFPDVVSWPTDSTGAMIHFNTNGAIIGDSIISNNYINTIAYGDFNLNGKLDLFINSSDSVSIKNQIIFEDSIGIRTREINEDSLNTTFNFSFMADFTSDGTLDIFLAQPTADTATNKAHLIKSNDLFALNYEPIDLSENSISFNFADHDFDGDLDLLHIYSDSLVKVELFKNIEAKINDGPRPPFFHNTITTSTGTILMWDESYDDHSQEQSLTYDVALGDSYSQAAYLSPNYSLDSAVIRLKTIRGNNLYENTLNINSDLQDKIYYEIQAIDNSLSVVQNIDSVGNGNWNGSGQSCSIGVACGSFEICNPETIAYQTIYSCSDESLVINNKNVTSWYSTNQGLLGFSVILEYNTLKTDTIYFNNAENASCENNGAYVVIPVTDSLFSNETFTFCEPTTIDLNNYTSLDSATWISIKSGTPDTLINTSVLIEASDVFVAFSKQTLCTLSDTVTINYDTTVVSIENGEVVEITEGTSLQLRGTNATSFTWFPTAEMDNPFSAAPIVTPLNNITYFVEGIGIAGCTSTDGIRINVKKAAYIPELFTPNSDGTNDALIIYGLNEVSDFSFSIYNRSGNLVFQTRDSDLMRNKGWNGKFQNREVPSGIYYWKISGTYRNNVQRITLNEAVEGKVHLTR